MKKLTIVCLTGWLFLAACENTGSSTVGSYEKEETSQSFEKAEGEAHGAPVRESAEGAAHGTTDTVQTSGDAPSGRSGIEVKTGENVSVDSANSKAAPHH